MSEFIEYLESLKPGAKPLKPNYRILFDARYIFGHTCIKVQKKGTIAIDKHTYTEFLHADGTRTNDL